MVIFNKAFLTFMLTCSVTFNLFSQQLLEHRAFSSGFLQKKDYFFKLDLYPTGKYIIYYENEVGDDMIHYFPFLFGSYTLSDQKLTLIDGYTNLRLEYQHISDTVKLSSFDSRQIRVTIKLIPITTFHFLQNISFKGEIQTHSSSFPKYFFPHFQMRNEFKQSNRCQKLEAGTYKAIDRTVALKLRVYKNKQYHLYCSKYLLSTGKWSKEKGKLILYDETLNQSINGVIRGNRILLDSGYELQYVKE